MTHDARLAELSLTRLYTMRLGFFLNFAFLGMNFVNGYRAHTGAWQSGTTIAYSLWGTLSVLSVLGLLHPRKMVPALLMQFTYKAIWALLFYVPGLVPSDAGLAPAMLGGIAADIVLIPWNYVLRTFVLGQSERWR